MKQIFVVVMALALAACGGGAVKQKAASAKPTWILDTPRMAGKLYGSGSAEMFAGVDEAKERAKDAAVANLLRELEVNIQASTHSRETLNKSSVGGEVFVQQVEQVIQTRIPEYQLRFVEAQDHFVDRAEKRVYMLVMLDLDKERGYLKDQLDIQDAEIAKVAARLPTLTTSTIAELRTITSGLTALAQRENLKTQLNRFNKAAAPLLTDEQQKVKERLSRLLAEVKVSIPTAVKERNRRIYTALAEQLTANGIAVTNEPGDINIDYQIELTSMVRDGVVFGFTDGDISLSDSRGKVILSFKAKAKGSSTSAELSKNRALDKLAKNLANEVVNSLF